MESRCLVLGEAASMYRQEIESSYMMATIIPDDDRGACGFDAAKVREPLHHSCLLKRYLNENMNQLPICWVCVSDSPEEDALRLKFFFWLRRSDQ